MSGGAYTYTDHLLALDDKQLDNLAVAWPDVAGWSHINTPMSADVWDEQLASHPDATYWAFLVKDLREGFRIGFRNGPNRLGSAASNIGLPYLQIQKKDTLGRGVGYHILIVNFLFKGATLIKCDGGGGGGEYHL